MMEEEQDKELSAIQKIIEALSPLDADARDRVVSYVFRRLNVTSPSFAVGPSIPASAVDQHHQLLSEPPGTLPKIMDIRSFKELKKPGAANEMAAVVAYFLAELAPTEERKSEISTVEIEKYFKLAKFPLPTAIAMALTNAKNAGYLDPGTERGTYKLNPVGHNLVAHNLPSTESGQFPVSPKKRNKKKATKKKVNSKKKSKKE
jgi:hypothetical protein